MFNNTKCFSVSGNFSVSTIANIALVLLPLKPNTKNTKRSKKIESLHYLKQYFIIQEPIAFILKGELDK